jgi:hypothetical protein
VNQNEWLDTDGDGIGDNSDPDTDGDGVLDFYDDLPKDPKEANDTDHDGHGDNSDMDIDGDGYLNYLDKFPLDISAWLDTDNDGFPDFIIGNSTTGLIADNDDDNDGVLDNEDEFPNDPTEYQDTDDDGIGDNKDWDIDNDFYTNWNDADPYDSSITKITSDDDEEEWTVTNSLLSALAILLIILILIGILNYIKISSSAIEKRTDETKRKEDEQFARIEEKFKPKHKHEEMARCSECGKIVPISAEDCPGCGLHFED